MSGEKQHRSTPDLGQGATGETAVMDDYRGFWTWCSLCHDGDQEADRARVEDGVAIYESRCTNCGDGFDVKLQAGTPDEERARFYEQMDARRWQQFTGQPESPDG